MAVPVKKAARGAKKGYQMPEKFTKGEIVTDIQNVSWVLGDSIGIGGFGEIYMASKSIEPTKYTYAVKIEPSENGPLFCERTVYINIGKREDIEEFLKSRGLKSLGIPRFHGFGHHKFKNVDYRFIVIDKLGKDLNSILKKDNTLPYATILKIGIQILHVLEYMNSKGYVHCDVKAGNLLLGESKAKQNQIYLVDFGLACKYAKVFKPNPTKAHNGTNEFTSRDAHNGVMTRRGDLEILAYNLLYWATGSLPWEKLTNCKEIQAKKESFMKTPSKLLADCYKTATPHSAIKTYFSNICKMEALDEPDYEKLEDILKRDLIKLKSNNDILEFGDEEKPATPVKKTRKKTQEKGDASTDRDEAPKQKRRRRVLSESDTNEKEEEPAVRTSARSKKATDENKKSWRDCPSVVNSVSYIGAVTRQKK